MFLSSTITFVSLTLLASTVSMWCPLSMPTVSIVSKCPSTTIEWVSAAKKKSCKDLARIQNCTKSDNFVYHCVLNEEATMLLEVCAPVYYLAGYCARFSEVYKTIINDPGLDCTKFDHPCPPRFQSNESFRYRLCYQSTTDYSIPDETSNPKQHDVTYFLSSGLLAMFAIIAVTLFLLLAVGMKFKLIQFTSSRTKEILYKEEKENAEELFDHTTKQWLNREGFTLQNEPPKLDKRVETEKDENKTLETKHLVDRTTNLSQGKQTVEENTTKHINEVLVTTEAKDDIFEKRREERETMVNPITIGRVIIEQEVKVNRSRTPFITGDYKEAEHVDHDAIRKPSPNVKITDEWEDCINDDEEKDIEKNGMMRYRILSNNTDELCSRKGIEKISDVRDALAKKLHIARKHIFVVNKEEGKILKDNTGIAKLIDRPLEVMIANQNRTLISGCCKMSCGHFTPQDALFEWTKISLLSGINAGRTCPECTKSWGMSELMEKGNMSLDEKIFFEQVFMINRRNPTQLEKHEWLNRGVKTVKGSKFTQKSSIDPVQNIALI